MERQSLRPTPAQVRRLPFRWYWAALAALLVYLYFTNHLPGFHRSPARATRVWVPKRYSQRITAIGDLHGDLERAARVLRFAGLIDHRNRWIGKSTILVQTGDIVDRGKDTIALYHLFDNLREQAAAAGGAVVSLLGNHELMNAFGDWRYVTKEDIDTFHGERNRRLAMSGQGWIGRTWLGNYSITARVPYAAEFPHLPSPILEDSLQAPLSETQTPEDFFATAAASFVHGGIHPSWSSRPDPIDTINEIGHSLLAKAIAGPLINPMGLPRNTTPDERALYDEHGPVWYRGYALEEDEAKLCLQVDQVRADLGVRRLIMGHTPHFEGIKSRCNGRVLLIDTGISRAYGGALSALTISYSLTPTIPPGDPEILFSPKTENMIRWSERETITALYENDRKEAIVNTARNIMLDTRKPVI